ncbi:MAG: 3',5'-cyclic-nucleotide phosphodiesterase [Motiliproteus sp.]|nr:3',5'-cyclic-nucleotide phosphodiesterase [Motiliproteus sp.]MCW9053809.1 3',5'-cyclic-nucleotide phosphodiesterase [Motiliproteus sp.]
MQVQVLGCSGGIGAGLKTTCLGVDESILIDAGTGLELLSAERMLQLRHLFITHAHLDHICCLPLMLPTIFERMQQPLKIYASSVVIEALKAHIFNWTIWPDYTQIPGSSSDLLQFVEIEAGTTVELGCIRVTALEVNHPTPTLGYLMQSDEGAIAFSGDTTTAPQFWQTVSQVDGLQHLLIDVSFPSDQQQVADASGHYSPAALLQDLQSWPDEVAKPVLHISHLKPGFEEAVMDECYELFKGWDVRRLASGDRLIVE